MRGEGVKQYTRIWREQCFGSSNYHYVFLWIYKCRTGSHTKACSLYHKRHL